jgi:hypothetical protein
MRSACGKAGALVAAWVALTNIARVARRILIFISYER